MPKYPNGLFGGEIWVRVQFSKKEKATSSTKPHKKHIESKSASIFLCNKPDGKKCKIKPIRRRQKKHI